MVVGRITYDSTIDSYDILWEFSRHNKNDWNTVEACVGIIKGLVPASNRTYNPATKTWTVLKVSYEVIKPLLEGLNIKLQIVEPPTATVGPENFFYEHAVQPPPVTTESLGAQLLKLLSISEEVLKDSKALRKAYLRKAMELHPDRNGGDGTKMSSLNEVYNAYTRT